MKQVLTFAVTACGDVTAGSFLSGSLEFMQAVGPARVRKLSKMTSAIAVAIMAGTRATSVAATSVVHPRHMFLAYSIIPSCPCPLFGVAQLLLHSAWPTVVCLYRTLNRSLCASTIPRLTQQLPDKRAQLQRTTLQVAQKLHTSCNHTAAGRRGLQAATFAKPMTIREAHGTPDALSG